MNGGEKVKQGKKPTVAQKRWISSFGLNPDEWHVLSWTAQEAVLRHKHQDMVRKFQLLG